jgi:hypothetical protein
MPDITVCISAIPTHEHRGADACTECGHLNPSWFTASVLWNLVMGGPDATDDPGGFLCPCCFIVKAERALGDETPPAWVLHPEARPRTTAHVTQFHGDPLNTVRLCLNCGAQWDADIGRCPECQEAATLPHRDLIQYVRALAEAHPDWPSARIAAQAARVFAPAGEQP